MIHQAKAFAALGNDVEHPQLLHVPIRNVGQRAHGVWLGRLLPGTGDFLAAGKQTDAETRGFLEAGFGHVHVALLENLQGQPPAGKQHRLQWKQRNDHVAAFVAMGVETDAANKRAATSPLMVPNIRAAAANTGSR